MQLDTRLSPPFHPAPIAVGFAIGCAGVGVGVRAFIAMTVGVVPTDEGGALADVLYAAAAYVPLAVAGALGFFVVAYPLRRWLRPWRASLALAIGAALGAVVAIVAGIGLLKGWMQFGSGLWTPVLHGLVLGGAAALALTLISAALESRRP